MVERMGVNGCAFPDCTAALIVADALSALRCMHRRRAPRDARAAIAIRRPLSRDGEKRESERDRERERVGGIERARERERERERGIER